MKKYGKFAALFAVVIGTVVWLATAGMSNSSTYYKTVAELQQMGDRAYGQRIRVGGDVAAGSIQRVGSAVVFTLVPAAATAGAATVGAATAGATPDNHASLKVAYTGTDPLPDTFKDGAQALADGKLDRDGVFRASKIQAKCASKYEAKPGQMGPAEMPINKGPASGVSRVTPNPGYPSTPVTTSEGKSAI